VYLVHVHNSYLGKTELRTLGHSQFGNLGQGSDQVDSSVFKPVDLDVEIRSHADVFIGYDYTFMVGMDEHVYGWGSYHPEDKFQFTPASIPFFDKYYVHKLTGY
jgi:alpha-tubulin suppressor-like RCC1 family protein